MNILYFANESRLGGANLSLLGLLDEMSGKHNVSVVVPIKEGYMVEELKRRGIPVYYRHSFWWLLAPAKHPAVTALKKMAYKILCLNNYLCAWSLRKVVKEQSIDIIHTNSSVLNTGGILAVMTGVPHVWHIREFGQEDFGFFSVWKYERICRFMNSHSDKVIAISQAVGRKFQDKISSKKLEVIYNGVSEENICCKTDIKTKEAIIEFLIGGRVSPEKGQEEAIGAVSILVKSGYRNLHLSIAGPGNTCGLKRRIAEEGIEAYVSILGTVKDMSSLRRKTDVELVCSTCEGFGRVTAEAMMNSNPVIGANTGATPELIRDGETGYLYEKGCVEDLVQKMKIIMDDPDKIRVLGKAANERSVKLFTRKHNAGEIEKVYREICREV